MSAEQTPRRLSDEELLSASAMFSLGDVFKNEFTKAVGDLEVTVVAPYGRTLKVPLPLFDRALRNSVSKDTQA